MTRRRRSKRHSSPPRSASSSSRAAHDSRSVEELVETVRSESAALAAATASARLEASELVKSSPHAHSPRATFSATSSSSSCPSSSSSSSVQLVEESPLKETKQHESLSATANATEEFLVSRYARVLEALPSKLKQPSAWAAGKRLTATLLFMGVSVHALSICPVWALPVCWAFVGLAFAFLFEIGHDCSQNQFFPSSAANSLVASLSLLPLIQPAALWASQKRTGATEYLSSWLMTSWSWRPSLVRGVHASHVLVAVFAAVFPAAVVHSYGWWVLIKYWLVPFVLFHVWMASFFYEGQRFTNILREYVPETFGPVLDMRLRSFLTFQLNLRVPSYHLAETMDTLKRMWNRASLDGSDEPLSQPSKDPRDLKSKNKHRSRKKKSLIEGLHDSFALPSFLTGFRKINFFESTLSVLMKVLLIYWAYLIYQNPAVSSTANSVVQRLVGKNAALPSLADAGTLLASATNTYPKLGLFSCAVILIFVARRMMANNNVYMVDFVTYAAPEHLRVSTEKFKQIQREFDFSPEALEFMDRLIHRTGLGEYTYFPPGTLSSPPDLSLKAARAEAEMVMFGCLDHLFAKTNTHPRDVDILIVNCSLFNPTPSLASMVINHYKMREDIQSYNLSGMGCSAGVIAVHLGRDLLRTNPNSTAVVISTENITQNWYRGNERGMLISNTLFRLGGAAVMLSNKRSDRSRARYRLLHSIRTHLGADDEAYGAVFQDIDKDGCLGVRLSKGLMRVAGEALKRNITTLGPLILPLSEQIRYVWNIVSRRRACRRMAEQCSRKQTTDEDDDADAKPTKPKPYVPNFKKAVDHFCVHAGGRAVLEAIESNLRLDPEDLAPSRAVLERYGNTSSSSIWYELGMLEKMGRIRRGHKIWQIAFGSGFCCNSAYWEAM